MLALWNKLGNFFIWWGFFVSLDRCFLTLALKAPRKQGSPTDPNEACVSFSFLTFLAQAADLLTFKPLLTSCPLPC